MALVQADFHLTDEQLRSINDHFMKTSLIHAKLGEDPPCCWEVTFSWTPVERIVMARFDGEQYGVVIDISSEH